MGEVEWTAAEILATFQQMQGEIENNKEYLTQLEQAIGDSDHGVNMSRGFSALKDNLPSLVGQEISEIIKQAGLIIMNKTGGAAGALYGSALLNASQVAINKKALSVTDVVLLFEQALAGIKARGQAQLGDKTLIDTLEPVLEYMKSFPEELNTKKGWQEIVNIAHQSMESTKEMVAKKGRASYLGERSRGHLDPGAVSCYLLIKVIAENAQNKLA